MANAPNLDRSRFVPSAEFARLAIQAVTRQNGPYAKGGFRAYVSCIPEATFLDDEAWFAPPRDHLDATPDALPEADERDQIARAQQVIGTRVERLLSNFAFEAAARREERFPVTEGGRFTTPVYERLVQSLPIARSDTDPVLSLLVEELREAARKQVLAGDWGRLREEPDGLVLEIAGPFERLPADRPRAKVVGGISKGRLG